MAVGYVQLSWLDLVFVDGFVIGASVLLVLEELFWMGSEQGERREENGAAGAEWKVLSTVLEMNVAGRGACVDGLACEV